MSMKTIKAKIIYVIFFFGLFFIAGCSSLKPAQYNFSGDEANSASISFSKGNPGVSFVFYDNKMLPVPVKGTYWEPVLFPAGVPLEITVHASYNQNNSGVKSYYSVGTRGSGGGVAVSVEVPLSGNNSVDIDVLFSCPPLEAGKKYTLSFRKESGRNRLMLIDNTTRQIIHQQDFAAR